VGELKGRKARVLCNVTLEAEARWIVDSLGVEGISAYARPSGDNLSYMPGLGSWDVMVAEEDAERGASIVEELLAGE
jgi:hypothetical protein